MSRSGTLLSKQFDRLGCLERAIVIIYRAVELTPDNHPNKPVNLGNLGSGLQTRFDRFGELDDLEQAAAAQCRAIDLTLDNHLDKPGLLNGLGIALRTRFDRLGELDDLCCVPESFVWILAQRQHARNARASYVTTLSGYPHELAKRL